MLEEIEKQLESFVAKDPMERSSKFDCMHFTKP